MVDTLMAFDELGRAGLSAAGIIAQVISEALVEYLNDIKSCIQVIQMSIINTIAKGSQSFIDTEDL